MWGVEEHLLEGAGYDAITVQWGRSEAASEYTLLVSGWIHVTGEWEVAVSEGLEGWWNKAV